MISLIRFFFMITFTESPCKGLQVKRAVYFALLRLDLTFTSFTMSSPRDDVQPGRMDKSDSVVTACSQASSGLMRANKGSTDAPWADCASSILRIVGKDRFWKLHCAKKSCIVEAVGRGFPQAVFVMPKLLPHIWTSLMRFGVNDSGWFRTYENKVYKLL